MNGSQATPQSIAHAPLDTSGRSVFARTFRIVLTALVVAAACYLAYGFGRLSADWRAATQPVAATKLNAAAENPLAAALPLAGLWSFDELDWNLRSSFVEGNEVAARLETLAAAVPGVTDEQLPDADEELVEIVKTLQIRPTERGANQVYRLDRRDFRAEFVACVIAGRMKTVALAVAYPQNGETWQVFEFTPRRPVESSAMAQTPPPEVAHLVPLPAGAQRSGGRYDDAGRLLMEFVSLDVNADQLLAQWKEAGWEARPSGLGNGSDFSYLCARGEEVIYAWSERSAGPLENLMLVRTESPENTKP